MTVAEIDSGVVRKRPRRAASKNIPFSKSVEVDDEDSTEDESDQELKPKKAVARKSVRGTTNSTFDRAPEDYRKVFLVDEVEGDGSNNNIVPFDRCFPSPMNFDMPDNEDLLWMFSFPACDTVRCNLCKACNDQPKKLELKKIFTYRTHQGLTLTAQARLQNAEAVRESFAFGIIEDRRGYCFSKLKKASFPKRETPKPGSEGDNSLSESSEEETMKPTKIEIDRLGIKTSDYLVLPETGENLDEYTCLVNPKNIMQEGFEFFCYKGLVHVYLNVSPSYVANLPKYIDESLMDLLKDMVLTGQLKSRDRYVNNPSHPRADHDTFDFPEAIIPEGFLLPLQDYQLRTVRWMMEVEAVDCSKHGYIFNSCTEDGVPIKIKLGNTGWFIDVFGSRLTQDAQTDKVIPIRVKGGALLDERGSGKKTTCLALVAASPFNESHANERSLKILSQFSLMIPSRATCVVCMDSDFDEWIIEASHCIPDKKIVSLRTASDHHGLTWRDLMVSDLIVVSFDFYNKNYPLHRSLTSIYQEFDDNLNVKGKVDMDRLHFHRIIRANLGKASCNISIRLSADYHWVVAADLDKEDYYYRECLNQLTKDLGIDGNVRLFYSKNKQAAAEFVSKFVKNNLTKSRLPLINQSNILIESSSTGLNDLSTEEEFDEEKLSQYFLNVFKQSGTISKATQSNPYGIKMLELQKHVRELLANDSKARILLLSQFTPLAECISSAFKEVKIRHIRPDGNHFKRQELVSEFSSSASVRVMLLTPDDAGHGLKFTAFILS